MIWVSEGNSINAFSWAATDAPKWKFSLTSEHRKKCNYSEFSSLWWQTVTTQFKHLCCGMIKKNRACFKSSLFPWVSQMHQLCVTEAGGFLCVNRLVSWPTSLAWLYGRKYFSLTLNWQFKLCSFPSPCCILSIARYGGSLIKPLP